MSQSLSDSIRSSREPKYSFLWALLILLSGRFFFFMVYFVNLNLSSSLVEAFVTQTGACLSKMILHYIIFGDLVFL